jgi:hypothetical protein
MSVSEDTIAQVKDLSGKYTAGFVTEIESEKAPRAFRKRSCVLSPPRRKSRNGCSIGA